MHKAPSRGDRTKNGAIIVDMKPAWDSSGYVVLCLWTEDTQETPHTRTSDPYVTWFARVEDDGQIICHQGHYYDQLSTAVDDFTARI